MHPVQTVLLSKKELTSDNRGRIRNDVTVGNEVGGPASPLFRRGVYRNADVAAVV
jgi:hypothetical protein